MLNQVLKVSTGTRGCCQNHIYFSYEIVGERFFNRSTFAKVIIKHQVAFFFETQCIVGHVDRLAYDLLTCCIWATFHYYLAIQRSVWRDIKFAVLFVCLYG